MVMVKHRPPNPAPAEKPRAVAPSRLRCAPGTSRAVLAELTAETAPPAPFALRRALDPHWVPNLRAVRTTPPPPADDMELTCARIVAWLTARPELGDDIAVAMILTPLAAELAEVS